MNNESQLQSYITHARASGSQDNQIREALTAAGYQQDIIEHALATQITTPHIPEPCHDAKKKNRVRIIIVFDCILIAALVTLGVIIKTQQDKPTQTTQTLPANITRENINFDGQTFSFNHPKDWISQKDSLTDADRTINTADYTIYDPAGGSSNHGLVQHGASFEVHVGKYGTGGIRQFKDDLEHGNQKGFYSPLSVAENITQTTVEGKPAITYIESTDYRQVVVIFFDPTYAVQLSMIRSYTETVGSDTTIDKTYQNAFYEMVGSFSIK